MINISIIIPVYNGAATIGRCLDSIYSQGLESNHFEVICVDDCSTDTSSIDVIENYQYNGVHPSNLVLIKHLVNKRQGAARNTGIRNAKGKWLLFIDCDDFLLDQSLIKLHNYSTINDGLDIIAFDYVVGTGYEIISRSHHKSNSTQFMSGVEYHIKQRSPSMPQELMYNKTFLLSNNLFFIENIRFEDLDFLLKAIIVAKKVVYLPIEAFYYVKHEGQTTDIGADKVKIRELFQMCNRVAYLSLEFAEKHKENSKILLAHSGAARMTFMKRDMWKLPFRERLDVLREVRLTFKTGNKYADFTSAHPLATCLALSILNQPIVDLAIRIKSILKRVKACK